MRGKRIEFVAQAVVIAIGIVLRLRQFLFARSIWLDEASFANGILDSGLRQLLTQTQAFVDPIGYVLTTKLGVLVLGETEFAFRWIALVAGIASLVVAALLARKVFETVLARVLFTSLLALAPVMVYYSNEAQQYALDVLSTLLVFWVFMSYDEWRRGYLVLILTGVILPWFSYAATLVLFGVGIALAVRWFRSRRFKEIAQVATAWGVSSGVVLLYARMVSRNDFLDEYWTTGFAPWPTSLSNLRWYPESAGGIVEMGWFAEGFVPRSIASVSAASWLILALIGVGAVLLARRRHWLALAIGSVVATAVIVSVLGLYPFGSRPGLFLVPIAFLLAVEPLDWATRRRSPAWRIPAAIAAIALLIPLAVPSVADFREPDNSDDMKGALTLVTENRQPDDDLVIQGWSDRAFMFYEEQYDLEPSVEVSRTFDMQEFLDELSIGPGLGRTWIVFTHRIRDGEQLVAELAQTFPLVERFGGDTYLVALFDFSDLN